MSQVTDKAIAAFMKGESFQSANTEVRVCPSLAEVHLVLHGNVIAVRVDGKLFIRSCGWETQTTKGRLNGIPGVHIRQKGRKWYLNGEEWVNPTDFVEIPT